MLTLHEIEPPSIGIHWAWLYHSCSDGWYAKRRRMSSGKEEKAFYKTPSKQSGLVQRRGNTRPSVSALPGYCLFWLAEWLAHVVLAISPDRHLASSGLPHVLAPSIHTLTPFRIQAAGESGRRQACGPLHLAAHRVRGCKTSPESRSGEPREVSRSILFPCLLLSSTRLAAGC